MEYKNGRRNSRVIKVGHIPVGGTNPIPIQSMTNTDPHDIKATLAQARALEAAGCDILRLTVPDARAAEAIAALKAEGIRMPLVADIHFDYRLALAAIAAGVDKVRINPGNIGDKARVRAVVDACREREIPIRIGVNSGSLEKHILEKYGAPTAEALAESALYHAAFLEELSYRNIAISVKASTVPTMIAANRILAQKTDYPLHLGVTEAGGGNRALVKSAVGIGSLLSLGIGDTVRVSLTDDPVEEIGAAKAILSSLGLSDKPMMDIVSCPTCGRTKIDLIALCRAFEARAASEGLLEKRIKVALMGCVVNGPGEASEADIGIAGGRGEALLFKKGQIVRKIPEDRVIDTLIEEIKKM
ncbi:MAG: flavodoxin-dependent (E)-4-hydroxy-3-methylbut-2-enyl-diphosphate synthase [Clostridia bacterium]|nr:flavodoxin-dependent (E)-4-hydroxy-3-methylbut-2-enyl-diphosphate synthase [Clostridia bacterium]